MVQFAFKNSQHVEEAMTNAFMTWHDDKKQAIKAIIETIEAIKSENDQLQLIEMDEKEEIEIDFGKALIEKVVFNQNELVAMLETHINNWDVDRMAQTDQIIILMALCEFQYFEDIPIKVSMNEYLEISKQFSTPQSSKFVNGVLDSVKKQWQTENKLNKSAKGLREN